VGGRTWTREEDDFLRENYGATDLECIAGELRRSVRSIRTRARYLGLTTTERTYMRAENIISAAAATAAITKMIEARKKLKGIDEVVIKRPGERKKRCRVVKLYDNFALLQGEKYKETVSYADILTESVKIIKTRGNKHDTKDLPGLREEFVQLQH